jgi:hypothetical protein
MHAWHKQVDFLRAGVWKGWQPIKAPPHSTRPVVTPHCDQRLSLVPAGLAIAPLAEVIASPGGVLAFSGWAVPCLAVGRHTDGQAQGASATTA